MGAVTSKVVMYKQVLLLVGLVFLSTSVRSHPVKPAADKEAADTAAEKAPEAAGDEAAAPSPADAEKGEAPAPVEETGDAAEAPSEGGHVAESKIDDAIQKMNELNDLFEEIVQSLGGKTADADEAAGDAAADGAAADADAAADGAAADTAADANAAADGAAADTAGDAATDAKADAKKV